MHLHAEYILDRFCVAGISHVKAGAAERGAFSLDQDAITALLAKAKKTGIHSVFVVSTCNRTEVYGYCHHAAELGELLCEYSGGQMADLQRLGYFLQSWQALRHLFRVSCGLDSQIVGDYEIQAQLKQAIALSQKQQMVGPILDRTINFVFQASKKVRTNTGLSNGTVSVSFAAIEWLQKQIGKETKSVLLVGSGKFGRNVCRNIRYYLPNCSLTLTNRTPDIAREIAAELGAGFIPFEKLSQHIAEFDVILVCTNAMAPVVNSSFFNQTNKNHLILDLSIPFNVDRNVADLPGIQLVDVDEISAITRDTINRRITEIPRAEAILTEYAQLFMEWLHNYRQAPAIRKAKENLKQLSLKAQSLKVEHSGAADVSSSCFLPEDHISKTVGMLVQNLKSRKEKGCQYIAAYDYFLSQQSATTPVI